MREINGRAQVAERVRLLLSGAGDAERPRVVRWQPSRRATIATAVLLVVVGAATLAWVMSARPRPLTVETAPGGTVATPLLDAPGTTGDATAPPAVSASVSASASAEIVIDVAGKVRHPGLYRLAPGARIDDAVKAAGGALPGVSLTSLNLAAKVSDGQQILVGVSAPTATSAAGGTAPTAGDSSPGPVNLNTADLNTLQNLPGVGPVTAQHILDWRTEHGSFRSVDQLQDVSGIGPAKFAAMKDQATV